MNIKKSWGGQIKLCSVYNAKQEKETLALKPAELQSFRRYVAALGTSAFHFPLCLVTLRKGVDICLITHMNYLSKQSCVHSVLKTSPQVGSSNF